MTEQENIFDNAEIGDVFKTRDGRRAVYINWEEDGDTLKHRLFIEGDVTYTYYKCDGMSEFCQTDDIVSKMTKPVSDESLDALADEYEASLPDSYTWNEPCDDGEGLRGVCSVCEIEKAYKAAFRKAEEIIFDEQRG